MSGSVLSAPLSVAVASEQALVAEAVRASLSSRDFRVTTLRWPGEQMVRRPRGLQQRSAQVGLLISDLDRWPRLHAASLLVGRVPARWIVLTAAPEGPRWGAVIEAGACLVLPSSTSLEEVSALIRSVGLGAARMPESEQDRLVDSWTELLEQHRTMGERVQSLTPREHEVLRMLYAGDTVARIAQLLEVSPATVRSQVKAVLRKLEVNSQLGAVAALGSLLEMEASG